jgi:AcrR family transcriptional regulator
MSTSTETPHSNRRGDDTRERLLDAVEALIADVGFRSLTHRLIAHRADVHVALLNYHFGNKEQLIEESIARRAARLAQMQKDAVANLRARGVWTIEDVMWAFWSPFAAIDNGADSEWRNYLCMVARLEETDPDDRMYLRHFGAVQRELLYALRKTLPGVSEQSLSAGFRYCRALFSREILARCRQRHDDQQVVPPTKPELLIAFCGGGLRSLAAAELPHEQVA